MSEHELVRAVRRGDDRAFEQLFSRYRRRISAYVHGLVGDHGRAEDLTQEVFMAALRRMRETEAPIAFKPWIYEIARNACIDEFRRSRRSTVVSFEDEPPERAAQVPLLADHGSPEMRWERKQQLGHLCGAFSGLSDNHYRVLVLRELEGLSYHEIAERMGMSRPVVESTLFRARRRLSQEYDELSSGRRCADVRTALEGAGARSVSSLGLRQRRRIAHHLDHCDTCLHFARSVGVDASALRETGLARRVAALLPFGWLRIRRPFSRWFGGHSAGAGSAQVAQLASGAGPAAVVGPAIAAAALLIAGGALPGAGHTSHAHRSPMTSPRREQTTPATPAVAGRPARAGHPPALARSERSAPPTGRPRPSSRGGARSHGRPGAHTVVPTTSRSGRSAPAARGGRVAVLPAGVVVGASGKAVSAAEQLLGAATGAVGKATGALGQELTNVTAPVAPAAPVAGQAAAQASQGAGQAAARASQVAGSVVSTTGHAAGAAVSSASQGAGRVVSGASETTAAATGLTPPPGG